MWEVFQSHPLLTQQKENQEKLFYTDKNINLIFYTHNIHSSNIKRKNTKLKLNTYYSMNKQYVERGTKKEKGFLDEYR